MVAIFRVFFDIVNILPISSIPVIHVLVGFLSLGLSAFVYFGLKHLATIVSVAILSKVPVVKKYL